MAAVEAKPERAIEVNESQQPIDPTSDEFRDYGGPVVPHGLGFDLSKLLTAESLRAVAAIVVALLVLRAPSQSPSNYARLLAVILIAWWIGGLVDLRNRDNRSWWTYVRLVFLAVAAAGLLLIPDFTGERLTQVLGLGLVGLALLTWARTLRNSEAGSRVGLLLNGAFYAALGVALLVSPRAIIGVTILALGSYWFIAGLATIVVNVRLDDRQVTTSSTWRMFLEWIQTRPSTADDRTQLYEKLFYEGDAGPRRLSRFFTLMGFATAIAAWGIVADSTAVVIGAMLVAPLMTPLMGTSLSIAMGWPRRALMSAAVALMGVLFAVGLSIVFGWIYGPDISTVVNTQVASRIGPTLVDLLIAVAAGGAGAFALSRPDVSDSLPGVAVAIALVPPLAVVGLMISQGDWSAASGASLLFITNLVAILLMGGAVFVLTGVVPVLHFIGNRQWTARVLGMVALAAVVVVTLLGLNLETFQRQSRGLQAAETSIATWIGERDLRVSKVAYEEGVYAVIVEGSDPPPPEEELGELLETALGNPVGLMITWVPTETYVYEP